MAGDPDLSGPRRLEETVPEYRGGSRIEGVFGFLDGDGAVLVRRSQTRGDEVMNTTKTGKRQRIGVPSEMTDTLRWHEANMLLTPEQQESDLMFPSITGGYRAPSVLDKPFAAVSREIGLTKHFTPRGLRRTFQDLARAASVESLIQRVDIQGWCNTTMSPDSSPTAFWS